MESRSNGNENLLRSTNNYFNHNNHTARATEIRGQKRQKQSSFCGIKWQHGYNPKVFYGFAFLDALIVFNIMMNIKKLPDLRYPMLENLLPVEMFHINVRRVFVLTVLWSCHFLRRFAEVLFVYKYRQGRSLPELLSFIAYYTVFSVWIGWSMNFHLNYRTPPDAFFIPGILICAIGGLGNFLSHLYLRDLSIRRNKTKESRILPDRCCFTLVACPHYFFEIITWIGFSLAAFTLAAWTFTLVTSIILFVRSFKHQQTYKKMFDGKNGRKEYPTNRKALIPLVV